MASTAPLKRKRSGEDVAPTEAKRVLRPRSAPETTTSIQPAPAPKPRVKKAITKRSTPAVNATTTNPGSNLLLQKDKIIEQLRLELAEANNKLVKTQQKLAEVEKMVPVVKEPTAADVYKTGAEAVHKTYKMLLEKVYAMNPNHEDITTDTFAQVSLRHLKTITELGKMRDGLVPAFDLMMAVAGASWCDPEMTNKMCGFGDSEEPFVKLDAQLLSLIKKREMEMKKEKTANAADWVAGTVEKLKKDRDYLARYGVKGYFPQSIVKLEKMA